MTQSSRDRRILVVEDDRDIRESMAELLESFGYCVSTAEDGVAALDLLEQGSRPHVILLDLMMPRMNGAEFRERQQKRAEHADIPVIVISADANASAKAQTMRANGFLKKPVKLQPLLETIERVVASNQP